VGKGYGEVAGRGPEDQKTKEAEVDQNGPRLMMWGKALSVKSPENKDDDVCDQRVLGKAGFDGRPWLTNPAGLGSWVLGSRPCFGVYLS
jgi:hypothetical protein